MSSLSPQKPKSKPRLVACRECHRSKLKCDRSYPCKSCIKRGCADICPNGTLVATKRQKSAIEASQLREKTAQMAERIQQLEEALVTSHRKTSSDIHPLLLPNEEGQPDDGGPVLEDNNDVIDAFGTLSIASDGRSKYHNQSAGADYFVEAESPDIPTAGARALRDVGYLTLPQEIMHFAALFPFGIVERETPRCSTEEILAFLPSPETAWDTCNMFFTHGGWLFGAINRTEFIDQVYSHIYSSSSIEEISVDRLSLLYIVIALGTLLDLAKPYDIRSTEPYFQLSRAAFCLEPIAEAATIPAIQSLHFMIVYLYMTDRHSAEHRWINMGILAKLTFSSGLHRDSGTWIRDNPQENERRRKLFWEIYGYDAWITFIMGRPPSFQLQHVQCKFPVDADLLINDKGRAESSFHAIWKYKYRSQCLVSVVEEAFGAKSPSYATVLKLDRKIRDFEIPASLKLDIPPGTDPGGDVSLGLSMQRYMLFCERETSLLYLHRSFFSQAIFDSPDNPLESKFSTSVRAAYRSACLIVAGTHDATVRHPELAARFWFFWSNLFSAAIVLGTIVTRSPACQLSVSAMNELDLACNLMEQRANSGRSAKAAPIMRRLRDKARLILTQRAQGSVDKGSPQSSGNTSSKDDEDELTMFVGRTRFISTGLAPRSRSPTGSPPSSTLAVNASNPLELRRRGSDANPPAVAPARRGSEPLAFVGMPQRGEGGMYHSYPSLVDYTGGAGSYTSPVTHEAMLPSSSSTHRTPPMMKTEMQSPQSWMPQQQQHIGQGTSMYNQLANVGHESSHVDQSGLYAPPAPNPGSAMAGEFSYTGELTRDGTWQQLMVQLGVMDNN